MRPFVILLSFIILHSLFVIPVKASVYYIHSDHQGSVSLITNDQGQAVDQQVYYPYGSTRASLRSDIYYPGSMTERSYTSQVSDVPDTGLYYYNARYYNPTLAKFTTPDTVSDGLNRYAYVGNNPVNRTDPSGHMAQGDSDGAGFHSYDDPVLSDYTVPLLARAANDDPSMKWAAGGVLALPALAAAPALPSLTIPPWALYVQQAFNFLSDVFSVGSCMAAASGSSGPKACQDLAVQAAIDPTGVTFVDNFDSLAKMFDDVPTDQIILYRGFDGSIPIENHITPGIRNGNITEQDYLTLSIAQLIKKAKPFNKDVWLKLAKNMEIAGYPKNQIMATLNVKGSGITPWISTSQNIDRAAMWGDFIAVIQAPRSQVVDMRLLFPPENTYSTIANFEEEFGILFRIPHEWIKGVYSLNH